MTQAVRVLDQPEDLKKIGVKPGVVEQWEDGRRGQPAEHLIENWYFDAQLDDGSKAVVSFRTANPQKMNVTKGNANAGEQSDIDNSPEANDSPNLNIHITTPDGKTYTDFINVPVSESTTAFGKCDVEYGPHYFKGNLKDYDIHVEPVNGIGLDVHLKVLVQPYRPGAGYIRFDNDEKKNYTWTCFPKGEVTGNLTANGKTWEVKGLGYHDHQWHSVNPIQTIHHWLWGRQNSGDYTVAIFDIVANKAYGFKRLPIIGIMDKNGKQIFSNTNDTNTDIEILERYHEPKTDKDYPKAVKYTYENNGTKVEYTLRWTDEIEVRDVKTLMIDANPKMEAAFKKLGMNPSYLRYAAQGHLKITKDGKTTESDGDVIYEFAYFGNPDPAAHL